MKKIRHAFISSCAMVATPALALAAGLPWEGTLTQIQTSLTGNVVKSMAVIAIVMCGLGVAFSEGGSAMRRVLWICLGLSISLGAASLATTLFT